MTTHERAYLGCLLDTMMKFRQRKDKGIELRMHYQDEQYLENFAELVGCGKVIRVRDSYCWAVYNKADAYAVLFAGVDFMRDMDKRKMVWKAISLLEPPARPELKF